MQELSLNKTNQSLKSIEMVMRRIKKIEGEIGKFSIYPQFNNRVRNISSDCRRSIVELKDIYQNLFYVVRAEVEISREVKNQEKKKEKKSKGRKVYG